MATRTHTYTIDSIEGNSNLGNPVFSNFGKMQNYHYLVLSPVKEDLAPQATDLDDMSGALNSDNMQFKLKKNMMGEGGQGVAGGDGQSQTLSMKEKRQ